MDKIRPNWESNPDFPHTELVPLEWVYKYRGLNPRGRTLLTDQTDVSLDELWNDIQKKWPCKTAHYARRR